MVKSHNLDRPLKWILALLTATLLTVSAYVFNDLTINDDHAYIFSASVVDNSGLSFSKKVAAVIDDHELELTPELRTKLKAREDYTGNYAGYLQLGKFTHLVLGLTGLEHKDRYTAFFFIQYGLFALATVLVLCFLPVNLFVVSVCSLLVSQALRMKTRLFLDDWKNFHKTDDAYLEVFNPMTAENLSKLPNTFYRLQDEFLEMGLTPRSTFSLFALTVFAFRRVSVEASYLLLFLASFIHQTHAFLLYLIFAGFDLIFGTRSGSRKLLLLHGLFILKTAVVENVWHFSSTIPLGILVVAGSAALLKLLIVKTSLKAFLERISLRFGAAAEVLFVCFCFFFCWFFSSLMLSYSMSGAIINGLPTRVLGFLRLYFIFGAVYGLSTLVPYATKLLRPAALAGGVLLLWQFSTKVPDATKLLRSRIDKQSFSETGFLERTDHDLETNIMIQLYRRF